MATANVASALPNYQAVLAALGDLWPYALLAVVLIYLSAMVSGYEAAFFSLRPKQLAELDPERSPRDRFVLGLTRQPQRLLATLLVANNLLNVAIVILAAFMVTGFQLRLDPDRGVGGLWWALEVVATTLVLLLLGEVLPKVVASERPVVYLRYATRVVRWFYRGLRPLTWLMAQSTAFLQRLPQAERRATVEELRQAIDLASEIDSPKAEKAILKSLVNLDRIPVRSILCARVDVKAVDETWDLGTVVRYVQEQGYSRLPVYANDLDHILGVLYAKDLLRVLEQPEDAPWHHLIRPAFFIPETKRLHNLLNDFKTKRLHIAIVVDEYGGTAGLVTLQDVLDEIFGEIKDETDPWPEADGAIETLGPGVYRVDAKMPLLDVCKALNLPMGAFETLKGETDSLGGLVLEMAGKFPEVGEAFEHQGLTFIVEGLTDRAIRQVRVVVSANNLVVPNGLQNPDQETDPEAEA